MYVCMYIIVCKCVYAFKLLATNYDEYKISLIDSTEIFSDIKLDFNSLNILFFQIFSNFCISTECHRLIRHKESN